MTSHQQQQTARSSPLSRVGSRRRVGLLYRLCWLPQRKCKKQKQNFGFCCCCSSTAHSQCRPSLRRRPCRWLLLWLMVAFFFILLLTMLAFLPWRMDISSRMDIRRIWARGEGQADPAKLRAKMLEIERDLKHSRIHLDHLDLVLAENSEKLPTKSHFGTRGPLQAICAGNDSFRCVRPFRHLETRWRIAPEFGLVGCLIQKSMSTLLEALLCLLFDRQHFLASGRTLHREFSKTRLCRRRNEFGNDVDKLRRVLANRFHANLSTFTFFAIVRHPVDRFLSGFVDKCVRQPHSPNFCLGCNTNLSCFVQREYGRMMAEAENLRMEKTFEDMHFFPQNWRCNFRSMLANYTLLRVPNPRFPQQPLADQLMAFLMRQIQQQIQRRHIKHKNGNDEGEEAEQLALLLREQLHAENQAPLLLSPHSTGGTRVHHFFAQRLWGSPFLMEFVVRMFWHDFRLFNFNVPEMRFEE